MNQYFPKVILASILVALFIPQQSWAVDCSYPDIDLHTQQSIDNFQVTYGNGGVCDSVTGTLHVSGDDIANIDGLANLIHVGGDLMVASNDAMTDINGLANLSGVGKDVAISGNDALISIDGLLNFTSVAGDLRITANDTLTNIDGRANLSSVSGDCRILEHQALSNIDGLVILTSVGDYLWIYKNHSLANLDGLANLRNTFSLIVEGNDVLTNLDGLSKLSSVDEALAIRDNASLTNINGLANLTGAVSSLSIIDNEILNNLDSLSGLTMTGSLGVKDHASLKNIDGLANLTGTVAVLRVNGNQALTNVDGLANLTGTETDLEIMGNASLENINGLSSFTRVDQFVKVQMNNSLTQCGGLLRLLDQWDDAEPGPGPGESGVPDVGLTVHMGENLAGCNSIEEVLEDVNTSRINAGLNDAWFNPETEGQGFFISVFPDLGFVSLAWFTYDTELPPDDAQANLGDPGHRWLTALGPIEDNQAVMNIEMTTGGIFDTPTEIQRTDPPGSDGTILLTFTSCNSGTVEYDIPSINRQGMVPVQRVAGDNIALCEVLSTE